jgi:hypothetical protein
MGAFQNASVERSLSLAMTSVVTPRPIEVIWLDLQEWATYRDKMNPQIVLSSRIENRPLSYDYISLVAKLDTKAACDVASCGVDTLERRCPRCQEVYLQRLSCGSWACPRCADRRNGSNTDWLVFKINRVWDKIDELEGFKHNRAFWKWEVTSPSGKYQYRISKRGMRHWKRFGSYWWKEYLLTQKPEFRGLELATYVFGQNWRSSDPLGVGGEAKRFGSAFHYHVHGYSSPFGWDRKTRRLYVVRRPKHDMFFASDEEFKLARSCLSSRLTEVYGYSEAKDVNLNLAYEFDGSTTEHRLWYSGRSPVWDVSHYLTENALPSGLHAERKSYLYSLLMTRNFQRYSGYGLYSVHNWKTESEWMKFLCLRLPSRGEFERVMRQTRCPKDGEVLDFDMSSVRPLEEAVKDGIPFLFRMSTRSWKKRRSRAYRRG